MKKLVSFIAVLLCSVSLMEAGSASVVKVRTLRFPTFADKVYDGTRTAVVTDYEFALSGVAMGDEVSVVVDTAVFDTAAAGIDREISVVLKLTGKDAAKYVPDIDTLPVPHRVISRKTLEVDTTGMVIETFRNLTDATDDPKAVVTTPAAIKNVATEVIPGDDVSLVTTAYFEDLVVGNNKTIKVCFALAGVDSANYEISDPAIVYAQPGKVAPAIDIEAYADGSFIRVEGAADGLCPNETIPAYFNLVSGQITHYSIVYGDEAFNAGFDDVTDAAVVDDSIISIIVPAEAPCGFFNAKIVLTSNIDEKVYHSDSLNVTLKVNVSKEDVVAIYNDVVGVRDMDSRYTAYQWYKDGQIIDGATRAFYQQNGDLSGVYTVMVTTTEGDSFMSCDQTFEAQQENPVADKSFDDTIQIVVITARGPRYNVLGQIVK